MSTGRFATPGKTRSCPHCKATILDSATVCPGCHHHLRFEQGSARLQTADTALRVDGVLRHPASGESWEYSVVLTIRNARGEEISRQVVGVGALQPDDERTFSLAVEVFKPAAAKPDASAEKIEPTRPAPAARAATPGSALDRQAAASVSSRPADARTPAAVPSRTTPRLGRS